MFFILVALCGLGGRISSSRFSLLSADLRSGSAGGEWVLRIPPSLGLGVTAPTSSDLASSVSRAPYFFLSPGAGLFLVLISRWIFFVLRRVPVSGFAPGSSLR
jgi:hypothetical protein